MWLLATEIIPGFCADSAKIWQLVGYVINIFKIAIPILIVLMAMVDLGKAVMAGKEDEIKKAQKMLIKRLIYGIVIFFVVTLVQSVFNIVGAGLKSGDNAICWLCATDPGDKDCIQCVNNPGGKGCRTLKAENIDE